MPDALGDAILSPADGKIIKIGGNEISIFMSLFDVHVNRAPVAGEIEKIIYREGRFRAAFLDDAQKENESNTIIVKTDRGNVTFTQIAGMIARRIVCNVKKGHRVNAGQRIGMIKFGSRVDLEMPNGVTMMVNRGEKVQSGRSIIAITKRLENV